MKQESQTNLYLVIVSEDGGKLFTNKIEVYVIAQNETEASVTALKEIKAEWNYSQFTHVSTITLLAQNKQYSSTGKTLLI